MNSSCNDEYSFAISSRSCPIFRRNSPARCVRAFLPSAVQDPCCCFRDLFRSREDREDPVILKQTHDQMLNTAMYLFFRSEEVEEYVGLIV